MSHDDSDLIQAAQFSEGQTGATIAKVLDETAFDVIGVDARELAKMRGSRRTETMRRYRRVRAWLAIRHESHKAQVAAVETARACGLTWKQIGELAPTTAAVLGQGSDARIGRGISAQAAQRRWGTTD